MQDSKVGASEDRLRSALKVVEAVTQGRSFWIATCNRIQSLPPELRRRFKRGTFFIDCPTKEERAGIWAIYEKKFFGAVGKPEQRPADLGWTGAEIEQCCDTAADLGLTLQEAAGYVVPVIKADPEGIKNLRALAHDRFIDASRPGPYQQREEEAPEAATPTRKIRKAELNMSPEVGKA
jgi:SpoVK/Ycf46/Vps4 family AAA+-type ATPase